MSWEEVTELLGLRQHPDTTRKESNGYLKRVSQEREAGRDNSIMIINDVHLPFERADTLEVIRENKDNITALIIAGDLMDCASISSFPKIEDWTFEDEVLYTHRFLKEVRAILDNGQDLVLINGNHEERWTAEIKRLQQKNMQKFINPNILEMIIEGLTIYDNGKAIKLNPIDNVKYVPHWFVNIDNKLIVAHPKGFSQVDGKMCENVTAHFINRGERFDAVVFGHTHKYTQMTVSRRGGKYAVENGCMCQPMDYADRGRLNYTPQHYCYTIVSYDDDKPIEHNDIKVVHLPEEIQPEEDNIDYTIYL